MTTIANLATNQTLTETYVDSVTDALNRIGCIVGSSTQSVSTGTGAWTTVSWDTEYEDYGGMFSATSSYIYIPSGADGLYTLTAKVLWASAPGANSAVEISTYGQTFRFPCTNATQTYPHFTCSVTLPMTAADYFQVKASQATGSSINITTVVWAQRVGL